ncbi:MAG: class I SAM-dependent methyltransferase [Pyrinomonadaceae bacterium]
MAVVEIEQSLARTDLALFEQIASQTTEDDKRSLLACQLAVRSLLPSFTYLEIGSYLGGSIQPYLFDDKCHRVFSIDKRPTVQPDERGVDYIYENNSTNRMLEKLRAVHEPGAAKIVTLDGDASAIDAAKITTPPELCFIDGEHTDGAAFSDFLFCLKVLAPNGVIMFHDAAVVYNGLRRCTDHLEQQGIKFRAYNLPDVMFVIEIGDLPIHQHPLLQERLNNNYKGYLTSLQYNDYYRNFANKSIFRWYRKVRVKIERNNVSK